MLRFSNELAGVCLIWQALDRGSEFFPVRSRKGRGGRGRAL